MIPKAYDGTKRMIEELVRDGEKSMCFKHVSDMTHPLDLISSGEDEFPATAVTCCQEIIDSLEPTVKTIGIENMDKFSYTDIVRFLKKLIRKDYKIVITGKNIEIDKFSV
jgi:hypothetical protein